MKGVLRLGLLAVMMLGFVLVSAQQAAKAGIVDKAELKNFIPTNYFFQGHVAPVQLRNSVAIRSAHGKLVLAGLVDTAGYSTETAQKYQALFITETKLTVEGTAIAPGQYGIGFSADGKFYVMDVAGNDVAVLSSHVDENMKRPAPLQVVQDGDNYRLCAGKKFVVLKFE